MLRILASIIATCVVLTTPSFGQYSLDGKPLDTSKDPDIDLFTGGWQTSRPFNTHGNLTERAVLSKLEGDPLKPSRKGAVLTAANRFSRATLDPRSKTKPVTLKGEQEVFYFASGKGELTGGGKTYEAREGIFAIVPEGIEFTITNTSDELLVMYLLNESVPAGFIPKKELVVKDEKAMALRDQGYLKVHWAHNGKNVFVPADGLATLKSVNYITFDPMTIGQPHSHAVGTEEVWMVISGKNLMFLGKEIRWQGPGEAYKIPPNGTTPHSNINPSSEPIRFLYFSRL